MPLLTNSSCSDAINDISLEILTSGYLISGPEWNKERFFSPHYSKLYFIVGGDAYIYYGEARHYLREGRVYLIPTDLIYNNACETSINFLYFNIRLINKNGNDYFANYPQMLECPYPVGDITELVEKYGSSEISDALFIKCRLLDCLLKLIGTMPDIKLRIRRYSDCVSNAMSYINLHLTLQLGVDEICENSFLSKSTLCKKFRDEVGVSIGTYIGNEVMSRCEQLLIDSDLSIQQISEHFGFCDQFYFSRRFKMKYGETPQRYRKIKSR